MSADAARARGQLWVGNYVRHYPHAYPDANSHAEPWDTIAAARGLIFDALEYVDSVILEHHLATDGSAQILEDITRARSSMAD